MPACTHGEFGSFSLEAFFHFKYSMHADGQSDNGVPSFLLKQAAWLQLERSDVLHCDYIFRAISEQYVNSLSGWAFRSSSININTKGCLILMANIDRVPSIAI